MNWLLIVVVSLLALYMWRGYRNGLLKTVLSMAAVIIALAVSSVASPYVSKALINSNVVYEFIENRVGEHVDIDDEVKEKKDQIQSIEEMNLPNSLKKILEENNNPVIYDLFDSNNFKGYIISSITHIIINGMAYILVFLITLILVRILASILDVISHLPVIHTLNKLGGLIFGAVHGFVILWVLCIVLTVFSSTEFAQEIFRCINNSTFLGLIYNNNIIMNVLMNIINSIP